MQHVLDVRDRSRARTYTRDKATLLAQVVRRFLRIEHHRGVEIREKHDEDDGQNPVNPTRGNGIGERRQPTHVEQRRKLSREVNQAACEDDRDNARGIHLQGNVRGLATHHLATLHALGVVHRNAALSTLDEDDRRDAHQHHSQDEHRNGNAHTRVSGQVHRREDGRRHAGHNAHEDDERHAVANAALRDKLAHPHDERSTRHQREHDEHIGNNLGNLVSEHDAVLRRLEQQQITDGVDEAQGQRQVTRDLRDAATTGFALFRPAAHCGNNALHQLHDDGCGDVRHDAQREDREVRQSTTGEQVEHGHGHTGILERVCELMERDARYRHVGAETIKRKDAQRKQNLLAQLGNLKRVDKRA